VFDEKFFLFNWDEEHPAVEIPAEVVEDKDHDWDLSAVTPEEKDAMLNEHQNWLTEQKAAVDAANAPSSPQKKK